MRQILRKERLKITGVLLAVALLAAGAAAPQAALAALPAPNWLPGQPMLAGGQIIAMWLPVPGAVKYIIYLDGNKLTELPANQYMGPAPEKGGEHTYEVVAVDASGAESLRSTPGKILVKLLEPPTTPIFRTNNDEKSVVLRWNRPDGATVFNVYKSESADGPYKMIASVQEETYKDSGLELDRSYFYSVSSKDMLGKESARSQAAVVKLEKVQEAKVAETFTLTIVPSRSDEMVDSLILDDIPIEMPVPTTIKLGLDGRYYVLDRSEKIFVLDKELNLTQLLRVAPPEGIRKLDFYNISLMDEETALITDLNNSAVYIIDLFKGEISRTIKIKKPTKQENQKVYDSMDERMRDRPGQPLSVTLLQDNTLWVADGTGAIVHHVTLDGDTLDWFSFYINSEDGQEMRLAGLPDMMTLEDGTVLVSTGVARSILRLDPDTKEMVYKIGEAATMVGKFIGFGGMCLTPDGTRLIVADPTMHTIQGFDLKTGKYIFSIGGPEKKSDPQQETRPLVDFLSPFFPFITGENSMAIFNKIEGRFDKRTLLEPLPVFTEIK